MIRALCGQMARNRSMSPNNISIIIIKALGSLSKLSQIIHFIFGLFSQSHHSPAQRCTVINSIFHRAIPFTEAKHLQ